MIKTNSIIKIRFPHRGKTLGLLSCLGLSLASCPIALAQDGKPAAANTPSQEELDARESEDVFAQIGKENYPDPSGVEEGKPLDRVTNVALPWDAKPAGAFATAEKIDSQEKLNAELVRMRKRYAPFMADLAPAIPARPEIKLEKFDWRLETEADRADISHALDGRGEWKQVRIPHYDGPINDAEQANEK